MSGNKWTLLVPAVLLLISPGPRSSLEAAKVEAAADMTFKADDAGFSWVRSHHWVVLQEFGPLEAHSSVLALRSSLFRNDAVVERSEVRDRVTLWQSTGRLDSTLSKIGSCALIEGVYEARSDGGIKFFGAFPAYSSTENAGIVYLNCPPPGPCGLSGPVTTSEMSLPDGALRKLDLDNALATVRNPESRESKVMEEWMILDGARPMASSSSAFELALLPSLDDRKGYRLIVQSPIHERNERHAHLPTLRLLDGELPPLRRGPGSVILARIEFSKIDQVNDLDFLYATDTLFVDNWLKTFLSGRLKLEFTGDERHDTHVFALIHLGEEVELLQSVVALPQCCCGVC